MYVCAITNHSTMTTLVHRIWNRIEEDMNALRNEHGGFDADVQSHVDVLSECWNDLYTLVNA